MAGPCPYVSRGGLKLAAALDALSVDVAGMRCADLGCNVGGFTDCLLQRGAACVFAVDTGYGALAWKLRQDGRVVVLERSNALHLDPRSDERTRERFGDGCDLVAIDLAWTRQRHALPAALRWLKPSGGLVVTLIKPHYEVDDKSLLKRGVLDEAVAHEVARRVADEIAAMGVRVLGLVTSPIKGGAGKGRTGNVEYLAVVRK